MSRLFPVLLAITLASPLLAQETVPPVEAGKRIFPPAFFTVYAPVTALDMVQRIPGFSIAQGEGRRGFGENAGNVLIDGERPSTKTDELNTILSRIPASEVERIELIEAAGADAEARGQGLVINVIRKAGSRTSGTYELSANKSQKRHVLPQGNAAITLKRGATTYELNAAIIRDKQRGTGPEAFFDGSHRLIETRVYEGNGEFTEVNAGGTVKTRIGGAKLNLNAKIALKDGTDIRIGPIFSPANARIGTETLFTGAPVLDLSWEVGGDIEFPLATKLTTKLIGLYRTADESVDGALTTERLARTSRFLTINRNTPSEAVFRIQNDWTRFRNHAIQFGAELAYNRLDARFSSQSIINGGAPVTGRSNVLVRETRLEPFVSDVWTLGKKWKIEAGAIAEFSKLRLSRDADASRSFRFIKPRLIATWTAGPATSLELRAERQVAQLDFGEFATSVDLSQGGQVDSGNKDLVPQKVTTLAAILRQKFFERGSIELTGEYELISDTQDLVPVRLTDASGNAFFVDGAGNIGSSRRWNIEAEITLPFDWATKSIGITGMEVKYIGHYHGSRVTDPVTGAKRRASFRPEYHQEWKFRHDLGKSGFAYGFSYFKAAPSNAYFVSQFRSTIDKGQLYAFAEYKKFKYGTIKLEGFELTGTPWFRDRYIWQGLRQRSPLTQIIERKRKIDPQFRVSLSGKF